MICRYCGEDIAFGWAEEDPGQYEGGWGFSDGMSFIRCRDTTRHHLPVLTQHSTVKEVFQGTVVSIQLWWNLRKERRAQ